jgi:hypothetical protein
VRKHRRKLKQWPLLRSEASNGLQVRQVFRSLDSDGPVSTGDRQLSTVCSDNKLFLQTGRLRFDAYSLSETVHSLLLVQEAISILHAARSQHDDSFIIAQGIEIGLTIDELFIANYEHLLLRLQSQLVETLTRKAVEALILNDLNKTQRKLLNWFSEFPGSQRPLSTTWPWSIKPSLAVLWGYVDSGYLPFCADSRWIVSAGCTITRPNASNRTTSSASHSPDSCRTSKSGVGTHRNRTNVSLSRHPRNRIG